MTSAVWAGLVGSALAVAAAVALALPLRRLPMAARIGLVAAVFVVMLMPLGELPMAGYVRGLVGDLSITTVLLLAAACWHRATERALIDPHSRALLMALAALAALAFYPLALGVGPIDPYAFGYGSPALLAALMAIALAAWYGHRYLITVTVLAAGIGWLAGIYDTRNLWDYLLDPLLGVYALGWWVVAGIRRWRSASAMPGAQQTGTS